MRASTLSLALCLFAATAFGADVTRDVLIVENADLTVTLYVIAHAITGDELLPDRDGDGIPDDADECRSGDTRPTVILGECDTGVPNVVFPNGCTITDRINALRAGGIRRTGEFMSALARLLNELQRAGILTGAERGAIQACAGRASR